MSSPAINETITANSMRLLDEDGQQIGVLSRLDALNHARNKGLDIVEVSNKSDPPVCKLVNASKYLYELKKKEKENAKKQRAAIVETKEIYLRPVTDDNDVEIKINKIREFIKKGHKVKIGVKFKGREAAYKNHGVVMLNAIMEQLQESKVERPMQDSGRELSILISLNKIKIEEKE